MDKGPLGVVVPSHTLVGYLLLRQDLGFIRKIHLMWHSTWQAMWRTEGFELMDTSEGKGPEGLSRLVLVRVTDNAQFWQE